MLDPFLSQVIKETRALALDYWTKGFAVETKPDRSLVTQADKAIERLFADRLTAAFPGDGLYGEEWGHRRLDAARVWVIDPIDGTQAFVMGVPVFSTLIALVEGGQVVQAVMDFPALDRQFVAATGRGAWMDGERLGVSACEHLDQATLTATSPAMFGPATPVFGALEDQVAATRFGLDAFGFASLARGRADLVVEANLKPYDYLAPSLIVCEAGGRMTDWQGRPLTIDSGDQVVASATAPLHEAALTILSKA